MVHLIGEYLELRPLPEADLPQLLKVYQGTPLYFEGIGDDASRLTLADVRAQWQAAQATPGRHLLGVYHLVTGLLIGAADVQVGAPHPEAAVVWLLIWGGFQRQGYGQDCMALLEEWLIPDQGVRTLCAIAGANEEGRSFLHLQGFQLTDEPAQPPVGRGAAVWACW
ncbi:MAG TPA: GNAT family N-acetyltransferase [Roseiflexaceae bacterium]|nr:GNAT family N-acetyltransferase [Roseiflexaceae bacterium]